MAMSICSTISAFARTIEARIAPSVIEVRPRES